MTILDTAHTFTLTVGGNNVSAYLIDDTFRKVNAIAHEIDTLDFVLEDPYGTMPDIDLWSEVVVTDEGANRVFGGYVTRRRMEVATGDAMKRVTVMCQDYTILLKTVLVDESYTDQTDEAILDNLFATYLAELTTANVTASVGTYSFEFKSETLFDCVQRIATAARAEWYIDYDGDLHYWAGTAPSEATYGLSDTPDWSTEFLWKRDTLAIEDDAEGIVNSVTVIGGYSSSTIQTDTFSGDDVTAEFYLTYSDIDSIISITVNNIRQDYETDFAVDNFVAKNGDPVDCLVSYHRGRVRWDAYDPPPTGVNNIVVKYRYKTGFSTTVTDAESIATYGRTISRVITDKDISSVEEAEEYAAAYLAEHAVVKRTGKVAVERYGLEAGTGLPITCSVLGLDEDRGYGTGGYGEEGYGGDTYVIQSVTTGFSARGVEHSVDFAEYNPTLGSLIKAVASGKASTGSQPQAAGNSQAPMVGQALAGNMPTQEVRELFGGIYQALWPAGEFSWSAYGTGTGIIVGLDTSVSTPAGKVLILDGGDVVGGFGDLNGHYGYAVSTPAIGLGEYGVSETITIDATNGIRFFDQSGSEVLQLVDDLFYLDGEIRVGDSGTPGVNFNGIRIYKSGTTYRVEGQHDGVVETYMNSYGELIAAEGDIKVNHSGLTMQADASNKYHIYWKKADETVVGRMGSYADDDLCSIDLIVDPGWEFTYSSIQLAAYSEFAQGGFSSSVFLHVNADDISSSGCDLIAAGLGALHVHGTTETSYANYGFGVPLFSGGIGVIAIKDCNTPPTGGIAGQGLLYVEDGALKYIGSAGTSTTLAAA